MIEALQALVVNDPDFDVLDRLSDVYCPFEAVGMVRQEIRHGHFLAHCLDPARPHGFGPEALRGFLRAAASAHATGGESADGTPSPLLTPLDAHLMNCATAEIRREWRRIDLLVVVAEERLVIAIELKIDAGEHRGQLRRYRDEVRREWPEADGWRHLFLYVTREGDLPSESDGAGWVALGLGAVAAELDGVAARGSGAGPARRMLESYLAMLRRHVVTNDRAEELAAKLWSRHREALEFLAERRPAGGAGVMGRLFQAREALAEAMSRHSGVALTLDHSTPTTIRFAAPAWDDLPDFLSAVNWTASNRLLLLEVAPDGERNAIRVRFVLGPAPAAIREHYYAALADALPDLKRPKQLTGMWTRLGTETLVRGLRSEDVDPEQAAECVTGKLDGYARTYLPSFDAALSRLRVRTG